MASLNQIEDSIEQLSLEEQLWLIERLAHYIRRRTLIEQDTLESQLTAMANDPEIQREIREIEAEFTVTELDGLDVA